MFTPLTALRMEGLACRAICSRSASVAALSDVRPSSTALVGRSPKGLSSPFWTFLASRTVAQPVNTTIGRMMKNRLKFMVNSLYGINILKMELLECLIKKIRHNKYNFVA